MSTEPPPPSAGAAEQAGNATMTEAAHDRRESISQRSEDSQTAADFIRDQMQLEADAREALPYVGFSPQRLPSSRDLCHN